MSQYSLVKKMSCSGWCESCQKSHTLPFGKSIEAAEQIMEAFRATNRLDYEKPLERTDERLDFRRILPGDRGHMFGVMECHSRSGDTVWLRAFSSLGTGIRDVAGWSPYLIDSQSFERQVLPQQREIKRLSAEIHNLETDSSVRRQLEGDRRGISRRLMSVIHDLYRFRNFRNEVRGLQGFFEGKKGIPGGVGDCCAPKLINEAINKKLKPVSLAEFYWGGSNKSGRKQQGQFFAACEEKCEPILGFILCGADSIYDK